MAKAWCLSIVSVSSRRSVSVFSHLITQLRGKGSVQKVRGSRVSYWQATPPDGAADDGYASEVLPAIIPGLSGGRAVEPAPALAFHARRGRSHHCAQACEGAMTWIWAIKNRDGVHDTIELCVTMCISLQCCWQCFRPKRKGVALSDNAAILWCRCICTSCRPNLLKPFSRMDSMLHRYHIYSFTTHARTWA